MNLRNRLTLFFKALTMSRYPMGSKNLGAAAGAGLSMVVAVSLLGSSPAWSSACVAGSVASYEALGATGCTIDGLTFGGFSFTSTATGTTSEVNFTQVTPVTQTVGGTTEFGFELDYAAFAGGFSGGTTDVKISYFVSSLSSSEYISDAFISLKASDFPIPGLTSSSTLNETLGNGATLSVGPTSGTDSVTFPLLTTGFVVNEEQSNSAAPGAIASSSVLVDAFSVTTPGVPEPATLALFALGLVGVGLSRRKLAR